MSFPPITTASVKVMRSFDYCHFEVVLGTAGEDLAPNRVDELRKEAARLADKAVAQYKVAKDAIENREIAARAVRYDSEEVERINAIAETDRTQSDQAFLKSHRDNQFRASWQYDYEDDFEDCPEED